MEKPRCHVAVLYFASLRSQLVNSNKNSSKIFVNFEPFRYFESEIGAD